MLTRISVDRYELYFDVKNGENGRPNSKKVFKNKDFTAFFFMFMFLWVKCYQMDGCFMYATYFHLRAVYVVCNMRSQKLELLIKSLLSYSCFRIT